MTRWRASRTVTCVAERLKNPPPHLVDAAIATVVASALVLMISVAQEENPARQPDAFGYLLGVTVGALLLARRTAPMLVLTGSVLALMTYYTLGYPAFPPAAPLVAAAYSAAVAGRLVPAAAIVFGLQLFSVGWQGIYDDRSVAAVVGNQTLVEASLLAAVLLLGDAVRSRRGWAREVAERLRAVDEQRELEAARRLEEQRLLIARELHDVMAHTIAGISVQAGVAAEVLDDAPGEARAALRAIREQSRDAVDEIAATVGLLRGGGADAPRVPAPGLAQLDGLVRMADGAGVDVDVSLGGSARPLPPAVDLTAYRIVQESLTNVVRHARASRARVRIDYERDGIQLRIEDDGRGRANGFAPGHGVLGMRERATALGGDVVAGPVAGSGFRVRARLPTRPAAS
jgi:signal transduction histidine kinase